MPYRLAADLTAIGNSTPDGFTGHEMLDGVGLIHMRGRVYDPTVGRFLSIDPIVRAVDASQSWNGYGYVEGRPLSWTDPDGWEASAAAIKNAKPRDLPRSAWISSYGYYTGDTTPAWYDDFKPDGAVIAANTPQWISTGTNFGFGDFSRSNGGSGSPVSVSEAQEVDREPLLPKDRKPAVTCAIGPASVTAESKIGLFGEVKLRNWLGGIHVKLDFVSANQSTSGRNYLSQGFEVSFRLVTLDVGVGYERTSDIPSVGHPSWDGGFHLSGWELISLSNEGLESSVGGGLIFGASASASSGPIVCRLDN